MSDVAGVTPAVRRVELDANAVLKEAWRLYKRLFTRSLLMGGVVFGVIQFVDALGRSRGGTGFALLGLVLAIGGTALLQGGLVEIVRGLHVDGDDEASVGEALGRASGRVLKLVRVSALSALGIGFACLLLIVPGVIVAVRWAVAVPVAMLEDGTARDALRRSRAIVAGNGGAVFKVLFAVGVLTMLVAIPLGLAAAPMGAFGAWVAATLASSLTAPYAAHALTVIYYTLVEPSRPVALDEGQRWQSIWAAEDAQSGAEPDQAAWEEYERRFDERNRQWG